MTGFEPATSSSRTTRATKLRHIPVLARQHAASNSIRIAHTPAKRKQASPPATGKKQPQPAPKHGAKTGHEQPGSLALRPYL